MRPVVPSQMPPHCAPAPLQAVRAPTGGVFAGTGVQTPGLAVRSVPSHWLRAVTVAAHAVHAVIARALRVETAGLTWPGQRSTHARSTELARGALPVRSGNLPHCDLWAAHCRRAILRGDRRTGAPNRCRTPRSVAVSVLMSQVGARHCVVLSGIAQLFGSMPLQVPSQPVPSPMQAVRGATGLPLTAVHVPGAAGRLHAWH